MSLRRCNVCVLGLLLFIGVLARAQEPVISSVPRIIRFNGSVQDAGGRKLIGVTFALYEAQHGGVPLWLETQNVQLDEQGRFTVSLGSARSEGVPIDLITSGKAQWLGIQPEAAIEQERVYLASVPYALKAVDADTLGGRPVSAFVLAPQTTTGISPQSSIVETTRSVAPGVTTTATAPAWLPNYLPKYLDATTLGNSGIVDNAGKIGIGTANPETLLDIVGNSSQMVRIGNVPWAFRFGSLQSGTQFIGIAVKKAAANNNYVATSADIATVNHTAMEFNYDGSWRIKQQAHQPDGTILNLTSSLALTSAGNFGIGVNVPAQKLEVAGNVKINGTGNGLMFPDGTTLTTGAATLGGITAGTGLTGGGTSGIPSLALDTQYTDNRYAKPAAVNTFSENQTFNKNLTVNGVTSTGTHDVTGNVRIHGTGNGIVFPDNSIQTSAVAATLAGITAGTGLTGGGTSGIPSLALDTQYTDNRYAKPAAVNTFSENQTFSKNLTVNGLTSTGTQDVTGNLRLHGTGNGIVFADGSVQTSAVTQAANVNIVAGDGMVVAGTPASPVIGLNVNYTDARYAGVSSNNLFTGDQVIAKTLAVNGSLSSGSQLVTGDVSATGIVSGATVSAHVGAAVAGGVAVRAVADSEDGTGLDVTETGTTGVTTGLHATVQSAAGTAAIFDNLANGSGTLLLGRVKIGEYWIKRFRVDANGRVYANNGYATGGADFAESFAVDGDKAAYEPGDVLVIDTTAVRRLTRSTQPYSTLIAGVYSTRPGVIASPYDMDDENLKKEVPLAVVGVVPCKVSAENGPVAIGDLLVTATIPGYAMKGTDRNRMLGAVLGKALQTLESGTGVIQMLVSLQ